MWGQNLGPEFHNMTASRGKVLIYPEFQIKVLTYGVSIAAISAAFAYAASKYVFWRSVAVLREAGIEMSHPVFAFLIQQEKTFDTVFILFGALGLTLSFLMGLKLSHRIAGPLLRLKNHLDRSAGGAAPARLQFRDDDFFQDLASSYNRDLENRGKVRRPGSEMNQLAS